MTNRQTEILVWLILFVGAILIIYILGAAGIRPVHGGQIQVRWNEATELDLKEYWIERKNKKRGSWGIVQRPTKGTSQTILLGTDGKGYWWRIRAVDESNNVGGPSNILFHKFPKKKPGRRGLNYGEVVVYIAGG